MLILFCCDPTNPRKPDYDFETEVAAAVEAGFDTALINYEALVNEKNVVKATATAPVFKTKNHGIYRGWMMKPRHYLTLWSQLFLEHDITLLNKPDAYKHCHYLPEAYPAIKDKAPMTVWIKAPAKIEQIMDLLAVFGDSPILIKDYVKSRKYEWNEACFIPNASDQAAVERVVTRFTELQGDDLNEGYVFRKYENFTGTGALDDAGRPKIFEERIFFLDGEPLFTPRMTVPIETFSAIAKNVGSRFFTMDLAESADSHDWRIIEVGDAQVSGLPDEVSPTVFYHSLAKRLCTK